MTSRPVRMRGAFSLLEVIIATAILAGSAMVLFALISLGTKVGNRAEVQTMAMSQTQSVMDEFAAGFATQEIQTEIKGVLPSQPVRSYRISVTPFELGGDRANADLSAGSGIRTNLVRVTVALYDSPEPGMSPSADPLCELSRVIRRLPSGDQSATLATGNPLGGGALK